MGLNMGAPFLRWDGGWPSVGGGDSEDPRGTHGTDLEVVGSALTEGGVHSGGEGIHQVGGDVSLDGACEAAAVDTVSGAAAAQDLLAEAEGQGQPLLGDVLDGVDVLEVAEGGAAGGQDALEEAIHGGVAGGGINGGNGGLQGGLLVGDAAVLGQEMKGAEDGAVAHGLAEGGDGMDHGLLIYFVN